MRTEIGSRSGGTRAGNSSSKNTDQHKSRITKPTRSHCPKNLNRYQEAAKSQYLA
jgi:hypothetical protein